MNQARTGIVAVTLAAVAIAGASTWTLRPTSRGSVDRDGVAHPAAPAPASERMLLVFRGAEPSPTATPTLPHVAPLTGTFVAGEATVVSDDNCAPDEAGISHCSEVLRLDNGIRLSVRQPHDMMRIPCLEPGERVHLQAA